jgi:hypothetical protein
VQVILESASKEKQKTEVQACSAMVAGAPSRHVSAAFCCIVFAICVSCNPFLCSFQCHWLCACHVSSTCTPAVKHGSLTFGRATRFCACAVPRVISLFFACRQQPMKACAATARLSPTCRMCIGCETVSCVLVHLPVEMLCGSGTCSLGGS